MLKKVFKHWTKKPLQLGIIVIGYVITILVISMMISDIQNQIITYSQSNYGKEENRAAINLCTYPDKNYEYETLDIIKSLGRAGEVDVLKLGRESFKKENKTALGEICPCYFESTPDWQPMLYEGRHLTAYECKSNSTKLVIGIKLAEALGVKIGDEISFYNTKYTLVGILGKKNLTTNFDNAAYIPAGALPKEYLNTFQEKVTNDSGGVKALNSYLLLRVDTSRLDELINGLNEHFNGNHFIYTQSKDIILGVDYFSVVMDIVFICLPLIIIALINIINISILWITSRRKEISIKKVLGASDTDIRKSIEMDMLIVAIFSTLAALILQLILYLAVEPVVNKYGFSFNLTLANFIISLVLAYAIGYLASIIPFEKTLDINPADALKIE